ncbi:MAG: DNA-binding response regulator, partial [Bacteroidetes bacterium]|nr:DNA-binding response regulator [Bacteroidota bacterium]
MSYSINKNITFHSFRNYSNVLPLQLKIMVEIEGNQLVLPKKEFELLELLASRPGKVYNRDQILA